MAIKQTQFVPLADVAGIPIDGTVQVDVITRVREMRFPHPSAAIHEIVLEPFVPDENGKKQPDLVVRFLADPQDPVPAEDQIDPETGAVLMAAGSIWPRLPSVAELHALPLPEGPQTVSTFGDLFNAARRQMYLHLSATLPQLEGGVEA